MLRRTFRILASLILTAGAVVASTAASGCGGIDCVETATCLDTTDAMPEDQSVPVGDTTVPDGADAAPDGDAAADGDGTVVDADAGHDADADAAPGVDADASDGSDASDASDADGRADADAGDGCVAAAQEDCTNGKDDNCNNLVDCADPDCARQQFACVPQWPASGWIAPVAVYDNGGGAPAPSPPGCSGPYATDLADGHVTPVAGADPCTCGCGAVTGTTCTAPFAGLFISNSSCTGAPTFASFVNTACGPLSPQGGINGAQMIDAGVPSGGSCARQTNTVPPPWNASTDWVRSERVCSLPATHAYVSPPNNGCAAGQYCAEVPAATFNGGKACLYQTGQPTSCPAGYTVKTTFFDGGLDTRSCSGSCLCGSPTGATCNSRVTLFAGSCGATTNPQTLIDTTCLQLSNYGGSAVSASMTQTINGGTCQVTSMPAPDGGIVPTGPATVCCPP